MAKKPLVSILIRTKDRKKLLQLALDSVLSQNYPEIETIIVNDNGKDISAEIIWPDSARVLWINRKSNPGRSNAANTAMEKASGKYFLFLDDDDEIDPDHVRNLVNALSRNAPYRVAYSAVRIIKGNKKAATPAFEFPFDRVRLMIENFIPIHAVLFDSDLYREGNQFDTSLDRYEDWDFWLQISRTDAFLYVNKCTASYRVGTDSGIGAKATENYEEDRVTIYQKWLPHFNSAQLLELMDRARKYPKLPLLEADIRALSGQVREREKHIGLLTEQIKDIKSILAEREQAHQKSNHAREQQFIKRYEARQQEFRERMEEQKKLLNEHAQKALAGRDQQIKDIKSILAEREQAHQKSNHAREQQFIKRYEARQQEFRERMEEQKKLLNELAQKALADRDQQIKTRQATIQQLHKQLSEISERIEKKDLICEKLTSELAVIHASKSWKLTRPLRMLNKLRYYLRTEGVFALVARIKNRLASSGDTIKPITLEAALTRQFNELVFKETSTPLVSIVIPVFNKSEYTYRCLSSIHRHNDNLPLEIIVVDDCSTDDTQKMLDVITGIKNISNKINKGFIVSCNTGAEHASGKFLVMLNNDTEVREGWLTSLVQTFTDFPQAGLVGSRLVFEDGTLQEAGGIVWQDGSAWNYGRGDKPKKPDYSYCREVDYCSGACLMIRLEDFKTLGGFDEHYLPAYYEDTDLAFKIREHGKKVYYQPSSTIIHFEGITSGTDIASGTKKYQDINRNKFFERWRHKLESHRPNGQLPHLEKERNVQKRVLVIDARVLMPDHDSGSLRMFNILKIFMRIGYKVTFAPSNLHYHEKYTPMMQAIGIECLYVPFIKKISDYLETNGSLFDVVVLSRADFAEKYIDSVNQFCPMANVFFDTVDLHFLREEREAALTGDQTLAESAALRKAQELAISRKANTTLVVSPVEIELFKTEAPDVDVKLLTNIHEVIGSKTSFSKRKDFLFIGNFEHPPNTDAMLWFLDEVFPLVMEKNPDIHFQIVGGHVPSNVKSRANSNVEILGFVNDITPLFNQVRLTVAPLRYGAGVKGKINSSMSYGVPVVATTIAAEGMNLHHEREILIADTPRLFADEILRLYTDENLWQTLSDAGQRNVKDYFSFEIAEQQLRSALAE